MPLLNDHAVGCVEIDLDRLLQLCDGVERGSDRFWWTCEADFVHSCYP
jgi:hypothetical protein